MKVNKIIILLSMILVAVFSIVRISSLVFLKKDLSVEIIIEAGALIAFTLQLHLLLKLEPKLTGDDALYRSDAEDKQKRLVYSRISAVAVLLAVSVAGWMKVDVSIERVIIESLSLFLLLLVSTLKIKTSSSHDKYKKTNNKIKIKKS